MHGKKQCLLLFSAKNRSLKIRFFGIIYYIYMTVTGFIYDCLDDYDHMCILINIDDI